MLHFDVCDALSQILMCSKFLIKDCFSFSSVLAFCEFLIGSKQTSDDHGTTWIHEMKEEFKFAMLCYGSSKVKKNTKY